MDATDGHGADVCIDLVGGRHRDDAGRLWPGGRYVRDGFNDDPESGFTGRPLRKVSMGTFGVVGVLGALRRACPWTSAGSASTRSPPAPGAGVTPTCCAASATARSAPIVGPDHRL